MKYIKNCPECGRKIRFPLDRGKIKIFCSCGYSTVIDPDDTSLYHDGKFDLSESTDREEKMFSFPSLSSLSAKFSKQKIINSVLDLKYKMQNLRYMPEKERNRFIIGVLFAVITIIAAIYFL